MGLFSKLIEQAGKEIGLDKLTKSVSEAAGKLAEGLEAAGIDVKKEVEKEAPRYQGTVIGSSESSAEPAEGESGFSWGPVMPDEETQYNFPGTYLEYFSSIFNKDFAEYNPEYFKEPYWKSEHFTFFDGGKKALVVELLSRKSNAKRIRALCRQQGIPYLRFYYDYDGWWNTRAYVVGRVNKALGK